MGQLKWVSVLATASAWLCTAGAWKLYKNHDLAIDNSFETSNSFLEAEWGAPYVAVPRTKNSDGSVSFIFEQSVNGYVRGHEPPKTSEEPGSTEDAGSDEASSNAGQVGSTGGPSSTEEISGTHGSGEMSTSPEHTGGPPGSTQGPTSSESVESAPSEGATGNREASTGSTQEPSSPESVESQTDEAAGNGGESTLPEEEKEVEEEKAEPENVEPQTDGAAGSGGESTLPKEEKEVEEEKAELEDIRLGPCRFEEMSVTGPGEYSTRANVQTLQACHEICLNDVRCNWYTYNSPNKKCHLKSQAGPIRHVIGGDVTSPKYCDSSCFVKNTKVLGTLLGTPAKRATAFNCHYECHFRSNCYYWSWDSTTGYCHLFGNTQFQGKTAARGFVSGPRDGCGAEAKEGGITAIP